MSDLDPSWRLYARLQLQSRHRARLDAFGWGIEAALNHLLHLHANGNFSDLEREANGAIARARARARHRTRLHTYYDDPREVCDPTLMLDDRARLWETLGQIDQTARNILLATGFGYNSATISNRLSVNRATVRKRIARLRAKLVS